jgi:hypothetical protein
MSSLLVTRGENPSRFDYFSWIFQEVIRSRDNGFLRAEKILCLRHQKCYMHRENEGYPSAFFQYQKEGTKRFAMNQRKSLSVKRVLADVASGATESYLRTKYDISPRGLEKLFKRLVAQKHIEKMSLISRFPSYETKLVPIRERRSPRSRLHLALPVYDLTSEKIGLVRDVSETGLRVAGIRCEVGELKTLQIQLDGFFNLDPILLIARCRWCKTKGQKRQYVTGGFEITALPQGARRLLKELVDSLVLDPSLEFSGHGAEETRRSVSKSSSSDYVVPSQDQAPSSHASKDICRPLPMWIDLDALKALQEIYRSGTLHEILEWWQGGKDGKGNLAISRPWFSTKRRVVWVHINEDTLDRALKKIRQDKAGGYGALSPLIEQLLWEFVDRPDDVVETEHRHEWK